MYSSTSRFIRLLTSIVPVLYTFLTVERHTLLWANAILLNLAHASNPYSFQLHDYVERPSTHYTVQVNCNNNCHKSSAMKLKRK